MGTKMKLATVILIVLVVESTYCQKDGFWRRLGKRLVRTGIHEAIKHYGDEAKVAERKTVANEALDELFKSIGRYSTFKMVNDMKEILDEQEAENSDNDFDENAEDVNQAEQDATDVNENNDKLDEETLKLLELLEDAM